MKQEGRHQPRHDTCTVLLIEELDDNHNIGSHEDILVLLPQQLLQEQKPLLLLNYPVGPNTLDINRKGKTTPIIGILSHLLLKVHIIHIAALAWCAHEYVLLLCLRPGPEQLEGLLVGHLLGLEGAFFQVVFELLEVD